MVTVKVTGVPIVVTDGLADAWTVTCAGVGRGACGGPSSCRRRTPSSTSSGCPGWWTSSCRSPSCSRRPGRATVRASRAGRRAVHAASLPQARGRGQGPLVTPAGPAVLTRVTGPSALHHGLEVGHHAWPTLGDELDDRPSASRSPWVTVSFTWSPSGSSSKVTVVRGSASSAARRSSGKPIASAQSGVNVCHVYDSRRGGSLARTTWSGWSMAVPWRCQVIGRPGRPVGVDRRPLPPAGGEGRFGQGLPQALRGGADVGDVAELASGRAWSSGGSSSARLRSRQQVDPGPLDSGGSTARRCRRPVPG